MTTQPKPLVHSFSSLKYFQGCPRKYAEVKIFKHFTDPPFVATELGKILHAAFERAITMGVALPDNLIKYTPEVEMLKALSGSKHCELDLALTHTGEPTGYWDKNAWMRGSADFVNIDGDHAIIADWKGFPLDQLVPTPTGFKAMRDLVVGEQVLAADGTPATVTAKSSVRNRPHHLKITFTDGAFIVCDDDHLWETVINRRGVAKKKGDPERMVVAADTLKVRDWIPLAGVATHTHANLLIDPYVLGLWLGDGKRGSGEISKPDAFIWEEIQRRGYAVNMDTGYHKRGEGLASCPMRTVAGLRAQLIVLNLLNNKHIPESYLIADASQRLDLLRGLMDSDGYANTCRRQAVFCNINFGLSDGVARLVASLGMRPYVADLPYKGFGVTGITRRISFTPVNINPFLMPRKADAIATSPAPRAKPGPRQNVRVIKAIERVAATPSQCISVESPGNTYLVGTDYLVTHNTGKVRVEADQLHAMATMVFKRFPNVQKIRGVLVFVEFETIHTENYVRENFDQMWQVWAGRMNRVEKAIATNNFPPSPSGLCKNHCCVKSCEHNGDALAR